MGKNIRHWRIFHVEDKEGGDGIEETLINMLLEPIERLQKNGINCGYTNKLPTDAHDRFKFMCGLIDEGNYPLGIRIMNISYAWYFINKAFTGGIFPDLYFLDCNLTNARGFEKKSGDNICEDISEISIELDKFISSKKITKGTGYFATDEDAVEEIRRSGGIYLAANILRQSNANNKRDMRKYASDIYIYTANPEEIIKRHILLLYSGNINLQHKNKLKAELKEIILKTQIKYLSNGYVDTDKILSVVNNFKKSIDRHTITDDVTGAIKFKDKDKIKQEIIKLLNTNIGRNEHHNWNIATFFTPQLYVFSFEDDNLIKPIGCKEQLEAIEHVVRSIDYTHLLTLLMLDSPLYWAGHDPKDCVSLSNIFLQEDWDNEMIRKDKLREIKEFWISTPKDFQNSVIKNKENFQLMLDELINTNSDEAYFGEWSEIRNEFRKTIGEVLYKNKSENSFLNDIKEELSRLDLLDLIYCTPFEITNSPFIKLISTIISEDDASHTLHDINWQEDSPGNIFGKLSIEIQSNKSFDSKKLQDDDEWLKYSGELHKKIIHARNWVHIVIHSNGEKRDPHKYPFSEDKRKSNLTCKKDDITIFEISLSCVKSK